VLIPNQPNPGRNLAATLRPKKYTAHQPAFFLFGEKSPSGHTDQISGDIPRFSLKEFIKSPPVEGWAGGVAYRHKSDYFKTRKNTAPPTSCLKKVLAKFPLFLK
jgi:hypothetical protein